MARNHLGIHHIKRAILLSFQANRDSTTADRQEQNGGHDGGQSHIVRRDPGPTHLVVQTLLLPPPRTMTSLIESEGELFPWEQGSKGRDGGYDKEQDPWEEKRQERQNLWELKGQERQDPWVGESKVNRDFKNALEKEKGQDPWVETGREGQDPDEEKGRARPDPRDAPAGRKESLVDRAADALGLTEDKESGEVLGWLAQPASLLVSYLLTCLHSLTGLDLLTALGLLLMIVCLVCLIVK